MKKDTNKKNRIIAYIILLITAFIWGGTWPLGRWMVSESVGGETIPPLMIVVLRYFFAVICFILILRYRDGSLNASFAKKHWKILIFMGLTSVTIYQIGYMLGELFTSASDASILVTTNAVWVIVLSGLFLDTELFTWRKVIGTVLAFSSVILVIGFSPNLNVENRILGDILVLIAAFSYATYTVASRHFLNTTREDSKTDLNSDNFHPSSLWMITWISLIGFIITLPIALIFSPEYINPIQFFMIPNRIWIGVSYLSFLSTVGAYTFYLEGIKRLDASRAAIFQTLVPLFGVILSAIFLGEEFDILVYPFSLLCVAIGIILVNYKTNRVSNKSNSSSKKRK
ncbi:MAG: EamA family transporter [Candidatus Lokiarchaeota archaeon]|nr:EamA family transporter [Candidatus Lokiarchaeota archaeon]MBD3199260.1 EamA family transporter [Candidatus Lokiarchaeota archaeon]